MDPEKLANELRRVYDQAQLNMFEYIANRLKQNPEAEDWAANKLAELTKIRKHINRQLDVLQKETRGQVPDMVKKAYEAGRKKADVELSQLLGRKKAGSMGSFSATDTRAVQAIVTEAVTGLESTHVRILRSAHDIYRQAVYEASVQVRTGTRTRLQASREAMQRIKRAQSSLNRAANHGITGFVDQNGRGWDLANYTEMSVRTAIHRASIQGHVNRMQQSGRDLVRVSDHAEECPLCRPWEGRVLSLSGSSDTYPALSDAQDAGLFHPNCSHTLSPYIHNISPPYPQETKDPGGYEERQQQRYNERKIRQWKLRKAVAMSDTEAAKAQAKISEWQERQRQFIDKTGRRRKYFREQVETAH